MIIYKIFVSLALLVGLVNVGAFGGTLVSKTTSDAQLYVVLGVLAVELAFILSAIFFICKWVA